MKHQNTHEKKFTKKYNKPHEKRHDRHQDKPLDTQKVCRFLSKAFASATEKFGRHAERGTDLYKLQVEFSYFMDEISRGPIFHAPKVIADCNTFIDHINAINPSKS